MDSPASALTHHYTLFISYRHADNVEMGRKWATWLHESVENFEVPDDLAGTTNLRGEKVPSSLYPVFRDEEELPADADLSTNIERALERSALLVVICSPRAVASQFVADEIRYFKELGRGDRVLALIVDGEPNASDDPLKLQEFGPAAECFPHPLRYGVAKAGGGVDWSVRTEPIAADCRPGGRPGQGWTNAAAYKLWLEEHGPSHWSRKQRATAVQEYADRLELARLKVVAGALGVPLGEITQRDRARALRKARRRARLLLMLSSVFAFLAGASVLFGWLAKIQRDEAVEQRRQAVATLAASDFLEGGNRLRDPGTARSGLAYLARAARAGHEGAASCIWLLIQNRRFWVPEIGPSAVPAATPSPVESAPAPPPPAFAKVEWNGEMVEPSFYHESSDGRRCVTVLSDSLAGGGPITFRVWETGGQPLGPWREVTYQGLQYVSGITSAKLSGDGRYLAVVASPWREPEFIEVWDVDKGRRAVGTIEATGPHPNYQGATFVDFWFEELREGGTGSLLVTLSSKGDAQVHRIQTYEDETELGTLTTNAHAQAVRHAMLDPGHELLVSVAGDRSIQISTLHSGEYDHRYWPLQARSDVVGLHVETADRFAVRLAEGQIEAWRLIPPIRSQVSTQAVLRSFEEPGMSRTWGPDEEPEDDSSAAPIKVMDRQDPFELQLVGASELQLVDSTPPVSEVVWRRLFSAPIAFARFGAPGCEEVLVQTESFVTEIWDTRRDLLKAPAINEASLFGPGSGSDAVLLSTRSEDGRMMLTRSHLWIPPNLGISSFTIWDVASGRPLSDRLVRQDEVQSHAEFSEDGRFVIFGDSSPDGKVVGSVELFPPRTILNQIPDLAEALGGLRLTADGIPEAVEPAAFQVIQNVRQLVQPDPP